MPPKHDAGTATRHYRAFWQRRCRAAATGAVLKPQGGNCAVLPLLRVAKTGTPCRAASLRCCYSFYYIICFACVNGYFDEYYAGISSLLFTHFLCRFFFPSFFISSRHSRSHTFILTYYPKVYLKSKSAGYFHFSAAPQQKSSGQQSASRCLPY